MSRIFLGIFLLFLLACLSAAYGFKDVLLSHFGIELAVAEKPKPARPQGDAPAEVVGSALCHRIEGEQPRGISTRFDVTTPKIYCWVWLDKVQNTRIRQRWILRKKVIEGPWVTISGRSGRMWGGIAPRPEYTGRARVEIEAETGHLLDSLEFELFDPVSTSQ
jgi:hypothetical protein